MAKGNARVGGEARVSGRTHAAKNGEASSGKDPIDVSHLRPMSEGVLRRAGLHGGTDTEGNVRDLRGENTAAFDLDPDDLPSDEPHVVKMRLERATGGIVERNVNTDGTVVLSLTHGDGDVSTASGKSTLDALAKLVDKFGGES